MIKSTLVVLLSLTLQYAFAADRTTIQFTGQETEAVQLNNELTETRYRTEQRQTTCTRQVPYQEQVCVDVPVYDTVCRTIPGYNDCRTVYDRVCRNETRYRRDCRTGPSRRECTTENRRVCRQEPGRRQCRTLPNGEQRCRDLPGHRICENKPERVCRTVPGERTCTRVPYSERVCENVSRQECTWVPSRQECSEEQVGTRQECHYETRYRTETYACTEEVQVPYEVTLATYLLNGNVNFATETGYAPQFELQVALSEQGQTSFKVGETNGHKPMAWLTKNEQRSGSDNVTINGTYSLLIKNAEAVRSAVRSIKKVTVKDQVMSFVLNTHEDINGYEIFMTLVDGDQKLISRKLKEGEFTVTEREGKLLHTVNMANLGIELKKLHKYTYKLGTAPIFKQVVAFPAAKVFRAKKEGIFYTITSEDIAVLKDELNNLTGLDISTDELVFRFPNHKLVTDAKITVSIGDFTKTLTKEEYSWNVGSQVVDVTVDVTKLDVDLNLFEKSNVTATVKYIFDEEAPLPEGFTHSASISEDLQPLVTDRALNHARQAANHISDVKLFKYSMNFLVGKSDLLKDFNIKLKIWKRSKVKIEREFKMSDVKIKEEGDFYRVNIDFKKFGGKVTKLGKHQVQMTVTHTAHEGMRAPDLGDLERTIQREMEAK